MDDGLASGQDTGQRKLEKPENHPPRQAERQKRSAFFWPRQNTNQFTPTQDRNQTMTHTLPSKKSPPSIIETDRLLLRTPRIEDAFALRDLAAADDAFANATVGQASSTLETACTAIVRMLEDHRSGIGPWWVVTKKDTGRVIGLTGFSTRHNERGPLNALATDVLGHGYAQEIIEALILSSSPMPRLHDSFSDAEIEDTEPEHTPPTRWYWHSKPARPTRPGTLRCA
ncbi:hypothetical protein VDG1235_3844 [Verrucomicrobiia bacterium DG1235]|nr:hypothetical protein VDG1235_3844 [Verrucomicrobiae bacterium DG1235]